MAIPGFSGSNCQWFGVRKRRRLRHLADRSVIGNPAGLLGHQEAGSHDFRL